MSSAYRIGRARVTLARVILAAGMLPLSANAGRIGAYLFDGTQGTQDPTTVADVGGDASLSLTLGSSALYDADTPFGGVGDTSLDVSGGPNERAANDTVTAYDFNGNQPFSISMWIKGTVKGSYQHIVGKRKQSTGNGYYLGLDPSGFATFFHQGQTVPQGRGVTGDTDLADGGWHFIAVVSDPAFDADGQMRLYVDGSSNLYTHHKVQSESPTDFGNAAFCVGAGRDTGVGQFNAFSGRIDEVALFDHALTTEEVDFYFNNSVGTPIEVEFDAVDVTDARVFEFQSLLGLTYRLDKATTLGPPDDFMSTGGFLEGDGNLMLMYDPTGFSTQDFYRIVIQ